MHAIGARLTDEIAPTMYNYGHLHVVFDDGSVGWYEAGWGPMMSETAFFVKDMIGPKGCVSIVAHGERGRRAEFGRSRQPHAAPTRCASITPALDPTGASPSPTRSSRRKTSRAIRSCAIASSALFLDAIRGEVDLTEHIEDALNSLRIVFAADESVRTGEVVRLKR